jgi:hypothetical protein
MQSRSIHNARTSKNQNVFIVSCCLALLFTRAHPLRAASNNTADARDIIKRSLDAGDRNAIRLHEYASTKRVDEKQLDVDGSVHSETVKTFDDVIVDGLLIRKLITKDGKPLPTAEARKEEERVSRIATSRKHETPAERDKRLAADEKKRIKQHEFSQEIFDAFDFRLVGDEQINGRKNWLIEATPAPGYKPKEMRAQIFPHLKGKVWVDQQDYLWTKAEAVAIDPFSVGFGIIARLEQGAHLYFDQTRLPDGVWLLRDSGIRAIAHFAIVKRIGIEQVSTFDNFRKVPSGVQVVEDSTGN